MAYSGNPCARFHDLLPLHALKTPLHEDATSLREHLETCAACRREVALLEEAMALLPLALPTVTPMAATRAKLMAQVHAEENGVPFGATLGVQVPPPVRAQKTERTQAPKQRGSGLLLAASVLLALSATGGAVHQHLLVRRMDAELAQLRAHLQAERATLERERQVLQKAEEQLGLLSARSLRMVALSAPSPEGDVQPGAAAGRILWDQDRKFWLFVAFRLPEPPPDRDYQLWFLVKDKDKAQAKGGKIPVSAGVLVPRPGGDYVLQVPVPEDLGEVAAAAVTLEVKGGAQEPSGSPLLAGEI